MTGSAPKGPESAGMRVVPDLDHPEKKAEIYNSFTLVRWRGNLPYFWVVKRSVSG